MLKGLIVHPLSILLALPACGPAASPAPRARVSGSVAGTPFAASDAAAIVVRRTGTPSVALLVTSLDDSCDTSPRKSSQVLSLGLTGLSGASIDAGTYGVYDSASGATPHGDVAFVDYQSTNAACGSNTPPNSLGASGRVTLTRADLGPDGGVEGSFDVLLESGDRLKGTFAAPLCGGRDAGPDAGCR